MNRNFSETSPFHQNLLTTAFNLLYNLPRIQAVYVWLLYLPLFASMLDRNGYFCVLDFTIEVKWFSFFFTLKGNLLMFLSAIIILSTYGFHTLILLIRPSDDVVSTRAYYHELFLLCSVSVCYHFWLTHIFTYCCFHMRSNINTHFGSDRIVIVHAHLKARPGFNSRSERIYLFSFPTQIYKYCLN